MFKKSPHQSTVHTSIRCRSVNENTHMKNISIYHHKQAASKQTGALNFRPCQIGVIPNGAQRLFKLETATSPSLRLQTFNNKTYRQTIKCAKLNKPPYLIVMQSLDRLHYSWLSSIKYVLLFDLLYFYSARAAATTATTRTTKKVQLFYVLPRQMLETQCNPTFCK